MQINSGFKLDVFYNGDIIDLSDDRRTVHQFGLRDKMVTRTIVSVKICFTCILGKLGLTNVMF